jgi:HNH endonuclease
MSDSHLPASLKQAVLERAYGCCEYCISQADYSPDPFSYEHIIPSARGGKSELENLALSCLGCNFQKYISTDAIDPLTEERVPLYHPRRDRWGDHFVWNDDFTLIEGKTPTGRATVERLRLNREGVVNLRQVLLASGLHPPIHMKK